jgi:small multidrug resistance pump
MAERHFLSWIVLVLAITLSASGTIFMKLSRGLSRRVPTILMFVFYGAALLPLAYAMRRIDISVAYAIWSGLGTAIITLVGFSVFRERITPAKIICIALIIVGVTGLYLFGGRHY